MLDGSLKTINAMTERKDPYTVGHQKVVSELSVKIAKKLNFKEENLEVLRIAGMIHDIGKFCLDSTSANR